VSTANTINTLGFEPPHRVQNRIKAGNALVWFFAIISTAVTLYYWHSLSGLEYKKDASPVEFVILWLSVALGLALELAKLYFIFVGGYKKLWISAVIVSVITVMGSYSILNQDRQNNLTQASDTYQDARSAREDARKKASKFAYVASTSMSSLKSELEENNAKGGSNSARRKSGMSYQSYVQTRADINKRIKDRQSYDSANATLQSENKNMQTQGIGGSSNPLFNSVGKVFAKDAESIAKIEGAILILFFFAITVLAEIFAYFIGEKVRAEQDATFLTSAQMQDMKNKELFGVAVSEMMPEQFARLNDAQRDRNEAEAVIANQRLNRTDSNGNALNPLEIARNTRDTRSELEANSRQARNHSGRNTRDMEQRYAVAKNAITGSLIRCPACVKEIKKEHHRTMLCSSTGANNCKDEYHNILNPEGIGARR
jgi:hypothetical protein